MTEKEAFEEAARLLPLQVRGMIRHRLVNKLAVIRGYLSMAEGGASLDKEELRAMSGAASEISEDIQSFAGDALGNVGN